MCKFFCTCASCVHIIAFLVSVVKNIKVTKHKTLKQIITSPFSIIEVILTVYSMPVSS